MYVCTSSKRFLQRQLKTRVHTYTHTYTYTCSNIYTVERLIVFGFAGPAVGERAGETGRGGERKEEETRAGMFFCMCVCMYVCMYVCVHLSVFVRTYLYMHKIM